MIEIGGRARKTDYEDKENPNIVLWWRHFGGHYQELAPGPENFPIFILATREWLSSIQHDQNRGIFKKTLLIQKYQVYYHILFVVKVA